MLLLSEKNGMMDEARSPALGAELRFQRIFSYLLFFFQVELQNDIVTLGTVSAGTGIFLRDFLTQDSFNLNSSSTCSTS